MEKNNQESLVVASLLASFRECRKATIFYINGALLILNRYALYTGSNKYSTDMLFYGVKWENVLITTTEGLRTIN